ncbi:hypothetical protein VT84_02675 [Gemmata sp. SH-PL17]|uniref:hypothetical protein n=1 Tax=Gemmata sp. SH-PL17 TaxID=1630693 RepID=UPI00078D4975|nr:hypothetical protein [Gemmata sp. SH-PL17]AMV23285.1 hypothetical protein VT84_02675 [Gemmata sp. SH-PL17]
MTATDPRAQWAELLSLPAGAEPGAAVAQFLRALPGADFVPGMERVAAVNALAETALPTAPDETVEQMLRAEVEAFAEYYWELSPAERLTTWVELSRRGAPPTRLRELERGLDVPVTRLIDPVAEELAGVFRTLFVLPPRERAIRRNTWLLEHAADAGRWCSALAVVQRDSAPLLALEPSLRTALSAHFAPALAAFVEGATTAPLKSPPTYTDRVTRAYEPRRKSNDGWKGGGVLGSGALIGVLIAFKLIVALAGSGNSSSRSNVPELPRMNFPVYAPSKGAPTSIRTFTSEEVAEFQRYERDTKQPPRETEAYALWVFAGRPAGTHISGHPSDELIEKMLTPTDITACQRYEREKAQGRNVDPPRAYAVWVLLKRPEVPDASRPRQPTGQRISFDSALIRACQEYDRTMAGSKPIFYEFWVKAGRPSRPGDYTLPTDRN